MERMELYGESHLAVLILTVLAGGLFVWASRRVRGTDAEVRGTQAFGWVMLIITVLWLGWSWLPQNWDVNQSLPFHFSDGLRFITAIALITRAGWAIAISYYWGLTLNLQSVITPDLNYLQFPVLEFTAYWFLHIAALLTPIVLIWGLGYRPTWRGYATTFTATVLWAGAAVTANAITGANYAYLSGAPEGASILDVLGPWPVYILWEAVLIAFVWALMTLPWTTAAQRSEMTAVSRFGLICRTDGRPQKTAALK